MRDSSELWMKVQWARNVSRSDLLSIEVTRNRKAIVFSNDIVNESLGSYLRSVPEYIVQRIELDAIGQSPEPALLDMIVQKWL